MGNEVNGACEPHERVVAAPCCCTTANHPEGYRYCSRCGKPLPSSDSPDPVARILDRAAFVKAAALAMDTSRTEEVTAGNLTTGDVILSLGSVEFPFPFTVTQVQRVRGVVLLRAAHGWFTMTPVRPDEACVRLVLSPCGAAR